MLQDTSLLQSGKKDAEDWVAAGFERLLERLNGQTRPPFHDLRRQALARFRELGFPTLRNEDWKYTSVAPLARTPFELSVDGGAPELTADRLAGHLPAGMPGPRLVFLDGHFAPRLSSTNLPRGLRFIPLAALLDGSRQGLPQGNGASGADGADRASFEAHLARHAPHDQQAFIALNTALLQDGAFLRFPRGTAIDEPVHLVFASTGDRDGLASSIRNLIVVEEGAQGSVIETYISLGRGSAFTSSVTEAVLEENAALQHHKVQAEDEEGYHFGRLQVLQRRGSAFTSHYFGIGGGLVRNEANSVLDGEGCDSTLNGLFALDGKQHADHFTILDHARPRCHSWEVYKGILAGQSTGIFSGRIIVRPDAQKTDAKQTSRNILLSPEATVDAKPQLEIYADDVKCTHGATVGQLDDNALFYLRSRGIDRETARSMLIRAFASDLAGEVKIEALRKHVEELLWRKLERAR